MLYKRILLVLILCGLAVFWLQQLFCFTSVRPLDGVKEAAAKPRISLGGFFRGIYQDSLNEYLNQQTGFRPSLVRFYSQINFTIFRTTHAPGVVVGKKKHLFIESYINDYIGANFVGKKRADEVVTQIKSVQDSLKKFNVDLIVIFAPGKASYFPQLIPDNYMSRKRDTTNYLYYSKQLSHAGVNFIDFNAFFMNNKFRFAYPIYPEYGTHWTPYAYAMAFDSILHYISDKRGRRTGRLDYSRIISRDSLKEREFDIGILLNLAKMPKHDPMPYPDYRYRYESSQYRPDVLAVGDSYWWCMVGDDLPYHFFKQDEYWFYNKDIYKRNSKQDKPVSDISFSSATANRDVIILMATEATLHLFPYGFIEKAFDVYCLSEKAKYDLVANNIKGNSAWMKQIAEKAVQNKISADEQFSKDVAFTVKQHYTPVNDNAWHYRELINEYARKIKKDEGWYKQVVKKAVENKITPEMQLEEDAWFLYNSEYGSDEVKQALLEIKGRILNTPEWRAQVEKKAVEKNITFEEMLELDAKFIYDSEHPKKQ